MTTLWVSLLGILLLATSMAVSIPTIERQRTSLTAEVSATNFLAYRTAVVNYLNAFPAFTGTVSDAMLNLTPNCAPGALYCLPGYIRDPRWTNLIQGDVLYVYSTNLTAPPDTLAALSAQGSGSLLIGTAVDIDPGAGITSRLFSANRTDTGIVLPGAIPIGVITMVGK
jgi:hypothetical protein